jgi:tetratricopeptide (TPR) repeat protein
VTVAQNRPSPAFRDSVRFMLELHQEMTSGDPDGEGADSIRDRMDQPWYAMSDTEKELVGGLSEDLYSIGRNRTSVPEESTNLGPVLEPATRAHDWGQVLRLLRQNENQLSPADVAVMRAVCWGNLGQHEVAVEFFKEAVRLAPNNPFHHTLLWRGMLSAGQTGEAARNAAARLRTDNLSDPLTLLVAANVLVAHATSCDNGEAEELYRLAVRTAEAGLARLPEAPDDTLRSATLLAYQDLALCYAQLGNRQLAAEACDRALALDPHDGYSLMLRGWLTQSSNPTSAAADFRRGFGTGLATRLVELPLSDELASICR